MKTIRYPENFLTEDFQEPACLLIYAGLEDESAIQRFAQESRQGGTILYAGVEDASPTAIRWLKAAQALVQITGIIISDHQASIFHAGQRVGDPAYMMVGTIPSGLRWMIERGLPGTDVDEITIPIGEFLEVFESLDGKR